MIRRDAFFEVGEEGTARRVLERILEAFAVRRRPEISEELAYLDTPDGRLYRARRTLVSVRGDRSEFVRFGPIGSPRPETLELARRPTRAEDFPEGSIRDELSGLLDVRCLLLLVTNRRTRRALDILDGLKKTVVRLSVIESTASLPGKGTPRKLPALLRVRPVRGYDLEHRRVTRFLEDELGLKEVSQGELQRALSAFGKEPGIDPSRLDVRLNAEMTADTAVREILRHLARTLEVNEEGLFGDLDIEFLHDFRVAVRRTRSVLSQTRGVFPTAVEDHYKREFKWLGTITAPTRDLDVMLENDASYRSELDEASASALDDLKAYVTKRRHEEFKKLKAALCTTRYPKLKANWSEFLDNTGNGPPRQEGEKLAIRLVTRKIEKRHTKILHLGSAIDSATPVNRLHEVRIECKKLRYLLETFGSLFPLEPLAACVRDLKRLQNNLGDLNDYEVHAGLLKESAEAMVRCGRPSAATTLAVGRLVGILGDRREKERLKFFERFRQYASPRARKHFQDAFAPPAQSTNRTGGKGKDRKKKSSGEERKR